MGVRVVVGHNSPQGGTYILPPMHPYVWYTSDAELYGSGAYC